MTGRIWGAAMALASIWATAPAIAAPANTVPTAPQIIKIETPELSATLHYPEDSTAPSPAVLVLGGSDGGREWASNMARSLAAKGYVALGETYFAGSGDGLSRQLVAVPVERLIAGIDRLASDPRVDSDRIAVIGFSKGAEASLLLASVDPRIRAVVAASPSDRLWQGIDREGGARAPSWTMAGQPLDYVPFAPCDACAHLIDLYRHSRDAASPQAARIPVETIRAPILLLVSGADRVWPSRDMALAIQRDRAVHRSGFASAIVDYTEAGHFLLNGDTPAPEEADGLAAFGGGTAAGLVAARQASWTRVVEFLDRTLSHHSAPTTPSKNASE